MANFCRVGDRLRSKHFELGVREQHYIDGVAYDDAGCRFVGELRVFLVPQRLVELHGVLQVLDRQIDENLGGDGVSLCLELRSVKPAILAFS